MGLDVTAYSKIQKMDAVFDHNGQAIDPETQEALEDIVQFKVNYDFPTRADNIEDGCVYRYSEFVRLHAGSYGGYNFWRNELAKMARYGAVAVDRYNTGNIQMRYDQGAWDTDNGPFWELITFSDCEGVIGGTTCAKLAKDFAAYQSQADVHPDEQFRSKYAEWRTAFDLAADGGAVDFH